MTERKGFTFRGVTPNTERRTIAVRLTLLLTLLASCLTFAPAASAQVWQSDLKVAETGRGLFTDSAGCGLDEVSCSTQLSSPSFRFDGKTYQINAVFVTMLHGDYFYWFIVELDSHWPRVLFAEPWKMCVNSKAYSLADAKSALYPNSLDMGRADRSAWEIGNSVRLAITSGPCP